MSPGSCRPSSAMCSRKRGTNAGRAELSLDPVQLVDPELLESHDLLHLDDVALHAGDLGDRNQPAVPSLKALDLDDQA